MRFPGKRKSKHYFPVNQSDRLSFKTDFQNKSSVYVVGIDQLLVDIEAAVDENFLVKHGFQKGQSVVLEEDKGNELYDLLKQKNLITGEYPGGTVGNTLHNYSVLSDSKSVLLGVINQTISMGDYAYKYLCRTSSLVNMDYLQPCLEGTMGKAICLITPDGERTFGICIGKMNELSPEYIQEELIKDSTLLLITAYLLRDDTQPLYASTMKAVELAKKHDVPVVLTLGTECLVQEKREFLIEFIKKYVNIIAMNNLECKALTGFDDPLKGGEKCLDFADLALITIGSQGLYLCGYVEKQYARETSNMLHSKSIAEYNKYEFSRPMLKKNCSNPLKIYSHLNPYMGGPTKVKSTNGAGDAALSALIHDISSNLFHKTVVPNSSKHVATFLSYSSLSQICKYANRVSYEVIDQNSPRLVSGLPEREDSLEEAYWEQ